VLWRALAAVAMGLAITGMHYTGMAAASFDANAICAVPGAFDVDNARLALGIAASVLAILSMAILAPVLARPAAVPATASRASQ
jgi:diguanylate cyclase